MQNKNSKQIWDHIWSQDNSRRFNALGPVYNLVSNYVPDKAHILELGAGIGFLANRLKKQCNADILAIDHSFKAIEALKKNGHQAKQLDLLNKKNHNFFISQKFDLVIATEFLEHMPNNERDSLLNTISECGPAIFSVPDNRLGPEIESQHYIKWNLVSFNEYLSKFYKDVEIKQVCGYLIGICGKCLLKKKHTLSVSYTLKNESETIYKAIESIKDVADEIIIGIDDSTVDNTKDECLRAIKDFNIKKYEIFDFTWENSFCKARNLSLDKCTCDWIFVIDGHEFLTSKSKIYLKNLHNIPVNVTNISTELQIFEEIFPISFFFFPKLIRNHICISYIYDVHNKLDIPFGTSGFTDKIIVEHKRSNELELQRQSQRKKMNIKGLKKQYENTKDSRHLFYIGNTYMSQKKYRSAISFYKKYLKVGRTIGERLTSKINMSKCYEELKEYKKSYFILLSSFEEDNYKAEIYFLLAKRAMTISKYSEARRWLKMATILPKPIIPADIFSYSMYTYLPWLRLAECEMRAGLLEDAKISLQKILNFEYIPEKIKQNVSKYQKQIGENNEKY